MPADYDALQEEKLEVIELEKFGMVDSHHPAAIPPGAFARLKNCDLTTPGIIQKRAGSKLPTNTTALPDGKRVQCLLDFAPAGATNELLAVSNGKLYGLGVGSDWIEHATGLSTGQIYMLQAQNKAWIFSGGVVYSWDGSALVQEEDGTPNDDPPHMKFAVLQVGRMFGAGDPDHPDRLYWSDALDFGKGAWNRATDYKDFDPGSGNDITGVMSFRNYELIVFTKRSIHVLVTDSTNPSNWLQRVIDNKIGTLSHGSIVPVAEDAMFQDQDGHIRSIGRTIQDAAQGAESTPVSYPIKGSIEQLDAACYCQTRAVYHNGVVRFCVSALEQYPDYEIVLDAARRVWSYYEGQPVGCYAISPAGPGVDIKLYGGQSSDTGKIVELDTGTADEDRAIELEVITRAIDFGLSESDKIMTDMEVRLVGTDPDYLECYARADFNEWTDFGDLLMLGESSFFPTTFPITFNEYGTTEGKFRTGRLQRGRHFQARLVQPDADARVSIRELTLKALRYNYAYS